MSVAVEMGSNGRIVIPAAMRRSLGVTAGGATFLADVVDGKIVLTAAAVVPRDEYEWLHSERVSHLLDDADEAIAQGRVERLTRAHMAAARAGRTDDRESTHNTGT